MHSARTTSAKCVNEEGKLDEHQADGMVYLYYEGSEYDKMFPVWNWQQLPGTTIEQVPGGVRSCDYADQLAADSAKMNLTGTVSDGEVGLSAMLLHSHALRVGKATALLPRGIVNLVSKPTVASKNPVVTTLENRRLWSNVTVATVLSATEAPTGALSPFIHTKWIYHNGTGYLLARDASGQYPNVTVEVANKTGSWETIGVHTGDVTVWVFTATVEHSSPLEYVVVPGVTKEEMDGLSDSFAGVVVVENTEELQAVVDSDRGQVLAAFRKGGTLEVPKTAGLPAINITVPIPLNVLVSTGPNSGCTVTIADPTARATGHVEVDVVGPGGCHVALPLPEGFEAGKSVSGGLAAETTVVV
mmetsp:Transcript_46705/g.105945  ORF Transcript_46705/g.105945 Transcript_46705/m.105945 type:complete len:359 (+) Transcript_46705:161-1237(+)